MQLIHRPYKPETAPLWWGSIDGHVYFLNPNGTLKSKFQTGGAVVSSPLQTRDSTIVVGSYDGHVYFLNPDGSLKSKFQTGGEVLSSPTETRDGTIVVGSNDGHVYFLNPDGTLKSKFQTGGTVFSSPMQTQDGTIVVGSHDGHVYFLKETMTPEYLTCAREKIFLDNQKKYDLKTIESCLTVRGRPRHCDHSLDLESFKKFPIEVHKKCINYTGSALRCDAMLELERFTSLNQEQLDKCMNIKNDFSGCDHPLELEVFAKYTAEQYAACVTHFKDPKKCNHPNDMKLYIKMANQKDACRYVLAERSESCNTSEGLQKFLNFDLDVKLDALNYFRITDFFNIGVAPMCSPQLLTLQSEYEDYKKSHELRTKKLIDCETLVSKNNSMVKKIEQLKKDILKDIAFESLYKASLTNPQAEPVLIELVKKHAAKLQIIAKLEISKLGIRYKDEDIVIAYEFSDKEGFQDALSIKSLACEKQFPDALEKLMPIEQYRHLNLHPNCLLFKYSPEKAEEQHRISDEQEKMRQKSEGDAPASRQSTETQL